MININNKIFVNKGIYNNKNVYENTIEAIKIALSKNLGLYLTVRETKDHIFVIYENSNLSRLHNVKDKIEDITYDELEYLSFYHIPTLDEVLKLINGKVDIILDLKVKYKNKPLYNILDNYKGKFLIIGGVRLLAYINKTKEEYVVGDIITKSLKSSILSLLIKTDFSSYDIKFYDNIKVKNLMENNVLFAYLIDNQEDYDEYSKVFDYLIIDNYSNLKL